MNKEFICELIGCNVNPEYGHCERCGRGYYDNQYSGLIWRPVYHFQNFVEYVRKVFPLRKCTECGKWFWCFEPDSSYVFCSKECNDIWMPF